MASPFDKVFDRQEFFSGGPNGLDAVTRIEVYDQTGSRPIHTFDSMLVATVASIDTERVSYFLNANSKVSLYSFDRALSGLKIQAVMIDAENRSALKAKTDLRNTLIAAQSQKAYADFCALYEREMRASVAIRKRRRIKLILHNMVYEGLIVSLRGGYASNADWVVIVNFEFLALKSEILSFGAVNKSTSITFAGSNSTRGLALAAAAAAPPTTPKVGGAV